MAFLASFLRTLTLAFAALHFLDPAPLGRGPRAPRVDARQCATRSKERAARAALWHRAKVNFFRSGRIFLDRLIVQIDQRFECSYQAPDFMSDVRCFWRGPPLVPTAAEKRVIRDARRKLREAHPDFTLTRETRDELIRESRDEATWLRRARAAQLSPDYEAATTEVWRHIRATPRGAPNTTDVRAWADKVSAWGPAWLPAFAVRSHATLLDDIIVPITVSHCARTRS